MSLPLVRKNGANFIEVVDSIGTHYIHIESIRYVRASYSQIVICTNIGNELITATFLDKHRMKEVILYLMDAIASHSVSKGDIDLIKEGMAGITHIHADITKSLSEVNMRLDTFKENIYQHIEDELRHRSTVEEAAESDVSSETTDAKEPIIAPDIHESMVCELFIVIVSAILILIFLISLLQFH